MSAAGLAVPYRSPTSRPQYIGIVARIVYLYCTPPSLTKTCTGE